VELAPPRTACSRAGGGCGRVSAGDPRKFVFGIFDAKSRVWGQFGPENEQFEGQPNEYDVVCRNASVLALHLWPTIFAGAPFQLQKNYRNGVAPRSRTITPLFVLLMSHIGLFHVIVESTNSALQ